MKQTIKISALAVISLLSSCTKHEQPSVNIICPEDFSPSRDNDVAEWYKETVANCIIANMGPKDRLTILPIDFNSATGSKELFSVDFAKNNYSNEFSGLQKDEIEAQNHGDSVSAAIHRFNASFDQIKLERQNLPVQGTDLFGAFAQCQKYRRSSGRNVIIVLSDMLQCTDPVKMNFETGLNTLGDIDRYLPISEKADLSGMDIIVLTGAQNKMKPEKFRVVRAFWERYITLCKGNLIDYSSGAVSKIGTVLAGKNGNK